MYGQVKWQTFVDECFNSKQVSPFFSFLLDSSAILLVPSSSASCLQGPVRAAYKTSTPPRTSSSSSSTSTTLSQLVGPSPWMIVGPRHLVHPHKNALVHPYRRSICRHQVKRTIVLKLQSRSNRARKKLKNLSFTLIVQHHSISMPTSILQSCLPISRLPFNIQARS